MFSYFKKPKLPTTLLIIAAFSALLTIAIVYIGLQLNNYYLAAAWDQPADRYALKEDAGQQDPLLTKKADWASLLAGPIISLRDPSLGDANAPVTIVEFSDFQCAYCRDLEQDLKQIMAKYAGQVRLIWKDYPDSDQGSVSYLAAKAARCADRQGNFWPYHDRLFAPDTGLNKESFSNIAAELKLDRDAFTACLNSSAVDSLITDNIKEANALDINGIPFIYVNNQEMMGQFSLADLERVIKLELSK